MWPFNAPRVLTALHTDSFFRKITLRPQPRLQDPRSTSKHCKWKKQLHSGRVNMDFNHHWHRQSPNTAGILMILCYDVPEEAAEKEGQEHNFSYKNGQMADIMKDKAQAAKDKASEMVGSGKDRTVESKDQTSSYVSHKAGAVKDMTCETVQAAKEFRLREPFIPRGIG
uniref:Uncharacterized protein n=2 Tax=Daucus carota subsp. sativus TaxID=79200 RepID=A0A164V6H6_DAUCS